MITRDLEHLRYRLYARKSTDTEDKQVQSLDDQVRYMNELAKQQGLHIVGEPICEAKSAKRPYNRPLFAAMLEEVEAGKIDGIICWKVDRLSRNPTDSGHIQQLLQDEKIKHILVMDRSYFPDDNSIVFSVEAAQSNEYVRKLAIDTKRGMKSKAEKGDKPGVPPIGYLNEKAEKVIIADPDRFRLVRILWDKMLTGTFSIAQLVIIADKELHLTTPVRGKTGGKPLAYSSLCNMFKNPFYAGKLLFNGEVYKGNQPPMISDEEFERVQQIIDPTHTTRPKDKTLNFQLRNLFKCGECGFAITAEQKFKTIKSTGERKSYIYYHCTGRSKKDNCSQRHLHVPEDELMRQIKEKLSKFTIKPEFYKLAIEALAQQEDEVVAKDQAKTAARDNAIAKKTQAIANLRRMRYNDEANDDAWYFSEMQTLEGELAALQDGRNKAEHKARDWRAMADETFTFARYAKEDFDSDDLEKKRTVVVKLGEKLEILDRAIQFRPNKYFIPLEEMNDKEKQPLETVRTGSQQRKTGSIDPINSTWLSVSFGNLTFDKYEERNIVQILQLLNDEKSIRKLVKFDAQLALY